jgi:hypothetical protein
VDKTCFEEALKELEMESYKKFLRSDEYAGYVSSPCKRSPLTSPCSQVHPLPHQYANIYVASWPTRVSSCAPQAPSAASPSQSSSRRSPEAALHSASVRRSTSPTVPSPLRGAWATLGTSSPWSWRSATRPWTPLLKTLPRPALSLLLTARSPPYYYLLR